MYIYILLHIICVRKAWYFLKEKTTTFFLSTIYNISLLLFTIAPYTKYTSNIIQKSLKYILQTWHKSDWLLPNIAWKNCPLFLFKHYKEEISYAGTIGKNIWPFRFFFCYRKNSPNIECKRYLKSIQHIKTGEHICMPHENPRRFRDDSYRLPDLCV